MMKYEIKDAIKCRLLTCLLASLGVSFAAEDSDDNWDDAFKKLEKKQEELTSDTRNINNKKEKDKFYTDEENTRKKIIEDEKDTEYMSLLSKFLKGKREIEQKERMTKKRKDFVKNARTEKMKEIDKEDEEFKTLMQNFEREKEIAKAAEEQKQYFEITFDNDTPFKVEERVLKTIPFFNDIIEIKEGTAKPSIPLPKNFSKKDFEKLITFIRNAITPQIKGGNHDKVELFEPFQNTYPKEGKEMINHVDFLRKNMGMLKMLDFLQLMPDHKEAKAVMDDLRGLMVNPLASLDPSTDSGGVKKSIFFELRDQCTKGVMYAGYSCSFQFYLETEEDAKLVMGLQPSWVMHGIFENSRILIKNIKLLNDPVLQKFVINDHPITFFIANKMLFKSTIIDYNLLKIISNLTPDNLVYQKALTLLQQVDSIPFNVELVSIPLKDEIIDVILPKLKRKLDHHTFYIKTRIERKLKKKIL